MLGVLKIGGMVWFAMPHRQFINASVWLAALVRLQFLKIHEITNVKLDAPNGRFTAYVIRGTKLRSVDYDSLPCGIALYNVVAYGKTALDQPWIDQLGERAPELARLVCSVNHAIRSAHLLEECRVRNGRKIEFPSSLHAGVATLASSQLMIDHSHIRNDEQDRLTGLEPELPSYLVLSNQGACPGVLRTIERISANRQFQLQQRGYAVDAPVAPSSDEQCDLWMTACVDLKPQLTPDLSAGELLRVPGIYMLWGFKIGMSLQSMWGRATPQKHEDGSVALSLFRFPDWWFDFGDVANGNMITAMAQGLETLAVFLMFGSVVGSQMYSCPRFIEVSFGWVVRDGWAYFKLLVRVDSDRAEELMAKAVAEKNASGLEWGSLPIEVELLWLVYTGW